MEKSTKIWIGVGIGVVALGVTLYITKDKWLPLFSGNKVSDKKSPSESAKDSDALSENTVAPSGTGVANDSTMSPGHGMGAPSVGHTKKDTIQTKRPHGRAPKPNERTSIPPNPKSAKSGALAL